MNNKFVTIFIYFCVICFCSEMLSIVLSLDSSKFVSQSNWFIREPATIIFSLNALTMFYLLTKTDLQMNHFVPETSHVHVYKDIYTCIPKCIDLVLRWF